MRSLGELRRHAAFVIESASARRQAAPFLEVGGGGSGGTVLLVKSVVIQAVQALFFNCQDVDSNGSPTGSVFDVYPWVVDAGGPISGGYDLRNSLSTQNVVIPRYVAGRFIQVWGQQMILRQAAGGSAPALRWWAVGNFHILCQPTG